MLSPPIVPPVDFPVFGTAPDPLFWLPNPPAVVRTFPAMVEVTCFGNGVEVTGFGFGVDVYAKIKGRLLTTVPRLNDQIYIFVGYKAELLALLLLHRAIVWGLFSDQRTVVLVRETVGCEREEGGCMQAGKDGRVGGGRME